MATTSTTTCPADMTKEQCEKEMADLEAGSKKPASPDDLDSEFEDEDEKKPPPSQPQPSPPPKKEEEEEEDEEEDEDTYGGHAEGATEDVPNLTLADVEKKKREQEEYWAKKQAEENALAAEKAATEGTDADGSQLQVGQDEFASGEASEDQTTNAYVNSTDDMMQQMDDGYSPSYEDVVGDLHYPMKARGADELKSLRKKGGKKFMGVEFGEWCGFGEFKFDFNASFNASGGGVGGEFEAAFVGEFNYDFGALKFQWFSFGPPCPIPPVGVGPPPYKNNLYKLVEDGFFKNPDVQLQAKAERDHVAPANIGDYVVSPNWIDDMKSTLPNQYTLYKLYDTLLDRVTLSTILAWICNCFGDLELATVPWPEVEVDLSGGGSASASGKIGGKAGLGSQADNVETGFPSDTQTATNKAAATKAQVPGSGQAPPMSSTADINSIVWGPTTLVKAPAHGFEKIVNSSVVSVLVMGVNGFKDAKSNDLGPKINTMHNATIIDNGTLKLDIDTSGPQILKGSFTGAKVKLLVPKPAAPSPDQPFPPEEELSDLDKAMKSWEYGEAKTTEDGLEMGFDIEYDEETGQWSEKPLFYIPDPSDVDKQIEDKTVDLNTAKSLGESEQKIEKLEGELTKLQSAEAELDAAMNAGLYNPASNPEDFSLYFSESYSTLKKEGGKVEGAAKAPEDFPVPAAVAVEAEYQAESEMHYSAKAGVNVEMKTITIADLCDFCINWPSFDYRLPTFDLMASLTTVMKTVVEGITVQILVSMILPMLDQLTQCPDFSCPMEDNDDVAKEMSNDFGSVDISDLVDNSNPDSLDPVADLFDECGLPLMPEKATDPSASGNRHFPRAFVNGLSNRLTGAEVVGALAGTPTKEVIKVTKEYVKDEFAAFVISDRLRTSKQIEDFFVCMAHSVESSELARIEDGVLRRARDPNICGLNGSVRLRELYEDKCSNIKDIEKFFKREMNLESNVFGEIKNILRDPEEMGKLIPPMFSRPATPGVPAQTGLLESLTDDPRVDMSGMSDMQDTQIDIMLRPIHTMMLKDTKDKAFNSTLVDQNYALIYQVGKWANIPSSIRRLLAEKNGDFCVDFLTPMLEPYSEYPKIAAPLKTSLENYDSNTIDMVPDTPNNVIFGTPVQKSIEAIGVVPMGDGKGFRLSQQGEILNAEILGTTPTGDEIPAMVEFKLPKSKEFVDQSVMTLTIGKESSFYMPKAEGAPNEIVLHSDFELSEDKKNHLISENLFLDGKTTPKADVFAHLAMKSFIGQIPAYLGDEFRDIFRGPIFKSVTKSMLAQVAFETSRSKLWLNGHGHSAKWHKNVFEGCADNEEGQRAAFQELEKEGLWEQNPKISQGGPVSPKGKFTSFSGIRKLQKLLDKTDPITTKINAIKNPKLILDLIDVAPGSDAGHPDNKQGIVDFNLLKKLIKDNTNMFEGDDPNDKDAFTSMQLAIFRAVVNGYVQVFTKEIALANLFSITKFDTKKLRDSIFGILLELVYKKMVSYFSHSKRKAYWTQMKKILVLIAEDRMLKDDLNDPITAKPVKPKNAKEVLKFFIKEDMPGALESIKEFVVKSDSSTDPGRYYQETNFNEPIDIYEKKPLRKMAFIMDKPLSSPTYQKPQIFDVPDFPVHKNMVEWGLLQSGKTLEGTDAALLQEGTTFKAGTHEMDAKAWGDTGPPGLQPNRFMSTHEKLAKTSRGCLFVEKYIRLETSDNQPINITSARGVWSPNAFWDIFERDLNWKNLDGTIDGWTKILKQNIQDGIITDIKAGVRLLFGAMNNTTSERLGISTPDERGPAFNEVYDKVEKDMMSKSSMVGFGLREKAFNVAFEHAVDYGTAKNTKIWQEIVDPLTGVITYTTTEEFTESTTTDPPKPDRVVTFPIISREASLLDTNLLNSTPAQIIVDKPNIFATKVEEMVPDLISELENSMDYKILLDFVFPAEQLFYVIFMYNALTLSYRKGFKDGFKRTKLGLLSTFITALYAKDPKEQRRKSAEIAAETKEIEEGGDAEERTFKGDPKIFGVTGTY